MKIKIAQYIDVAVPQSANEDDTWDIINKAIGPNSLLRKNMDFVIESVDDDTDHPLVDEIVGN